MLTTADIAEDWTRPLYVRQVEALGELAEMAMEVARAMKAEVLTGDETRRAWAVQAFDRAARSARLSFMLQDRQIQALEGRDRGQASDAADRARTVRRERVQQVKAIIERIADRAGHDQIETYHLAHQTAERLDRDDIYGDILRRPVSELIGLICKDLGLDPDWPRLAEEAWMRGERTPPSPEAGTIPPLAPSAPRPQDPPPLKPAPH
jgi:hypothetical protein